MLVHDEHRGRTFVGQGGTHYVWYFAHMLRLAGSSASRPARISRTRSGGSRCNRAARSQRSKRWGPTHGPNFWQRSKARSSSFSSLVSGRCAVREELAATGATLLIVDGMGGDEGADTALRVRTRVGLGHASVELTF